MATRREKWANMRQEARDRMALTPLQDSAVRGRTENTEDRYAAVGSLSPLESTAEQLDWREDSHGQSDTGRFNYRYKNRSESSEMVTPPRRPPASQQGSASMNRQSPLPRPTERVPALPLGGGDLGGTTRSSRDSRSSSGTRAAKSQSATQPQDGGDSSSAASRTRTVIKSQRLDLKTFEDQSSELSGSSNTSPGSSFLRPSSRNPSASQVSDMLRSTYNRNRVHVSPSFGTQRASRNPSSENREPVTSPKEQNRSSGSASGVPSGNLFTAIGSRRVPSGGGDGGEFFSGDCEVSENHDRRFFQVPPPYQLSSASGNSRPAKAEQPSKEQERMPQRSSDAASHRLPIIEEDASSLVPVENLLDKEDDDDRRYRREQSPLLDDIERRFAAIQAAAVASVANAAQSGGGGSRQLPAPYSRERSPNMTPPLPVDGGRSAISPTTIGGTLNGISGRTSPMSFTLDGTHTRMEVQLSSLQLELAQEKKNNIHAEQRINALLKEVESMREAQQQLVESQRTQKDELEEIITKQKNLLELSGSVGASTTTANAPGRVLPAAGETASSAPSPPPPSLASTLTLPRADSTSDDTRRLHAELAELRRYVSELECSLQEAAMSLEEKDHEIEHKDARIRELVKKNAEISAAAAASFREGFRNAESHPEHNVVEQSMIDVSMISTGASTVAHETEVEDRDQGEDSHLDHTHETNNNNNNSSTATATPTATTTTPAAAVHRDSATDSDKKSITNPNSSNQTGTATTSKAAPLDVQSVAVASAPSSIPSPNAVPTAVPTPSHPSEHVMSVGLASARTSTSAPSQPAAARPSSAPRVRVSLVTLQSEEIPSRKQSTARHSAKTPERSARSTAHPPAVNHAAASHDTTSSIFGHAKASASVNRNNSGASHMSSAASDLPSTSSLPVKRKSASAQRQTGGGRTSARRTSARAGSTQRSPSDSHRAGSTTSERVDGILSGRAGTETGTTPLRTSVSPTRKGSATRRYSRLRNSTSPSGTHTGRRSTNYIASPARQQTAVTTSATAPFSGAFSRQSTVKTDAERRSTVTSSRSHRPRLQSSAVTTTTPTPSRTVVTWGPRHEPKAPLLPEPKAEHVAVVRDPKPYASENFVTTYHPNRVVRYRDGEDPENKLRAEHERSTSYQGSGNTTGEY